MTPKKRFNVLRRFDFRCVYCGRCPPEVELTVDHRISKVTGGDDDDDNLVAACRECNSGKGAGSDVSDIVIVIGSDGLIDHKRSLKLSGLWSTLEPWSRNLLERPPPPPPLEVVIADVRDCERAITCATESLRLAKARAFRAQAHAWFTRPSLHPPADPRS